MDLNDPAHPGHSNYLISTNGLRAVPVEYSDQPLFESTRSELLRLCDMNTYEACGLISAEEQEIVSILNIHTDPQRNFYFDPEDFEQSIEYIYDTRESEIMGIWHTHPNGYPWPSPRDIAGWPNPQLGWRYFLVSRGDVTEWRLVRDNAKV